MQWEDHVNYWIPICVQTLKNTMLNFINYEYSGLMGPIKSTELITLKTVLKIFQN